MVNILSQIYSVTHILGNFSLAGFSLSLASCHDNGPLSPALESSAGPCKPCPPHTREFSGHQSLHPARYFCSDFASLLFLQTTARVWLKGWKTTARGSNSPMFINQVLLEHSSNHHLWLLLATIEVRSWDRHLMDHKA